MLEGRKADYYIDLTKPSPHPWTTLGPLDGNRPQKSATNHPSDAAANPNNQERVTTVKGIDKRVGKDGAISYRARVRVKGHPPVTKTFNSYTLAKKWKKNTEVEIDSGRYFDKLESQKHTLGEAVDRYIELVLPRKPKNASNVQQHLLWWKKQLGDYTLDSLKPSLVAEMRDLLTTESTYRNKARSPATVVRYLSSLSHLFTVAINEWGWLNENPIRKIAKPKISNNRVRFLSDDERIRILDGCKKSRCPVLYLVVLLALSTGMRSGEILKLTRKDVDFDLCVLTLQDTKNGEVRSIPLIGLPLELLKAHCFALPENYLLLFPSPKSPKRPIDIRSAWEKVIKDAGVQDFRFHDLRHTTASYLAMNGHSLLDIATLLGHKDLQMTKRYAHLSQEYKKGMISTMMDKILG